MLGSRGMVVLGAVVLAGLAFFVLMRGGGSDRGEMGRGGAMSAASGPREVQAVKPKNSNGNPEGMTSQALPPRDAPALDDIDAESRAKMRELLREAGEE